MVIDKVSYSNDFKVAQLQFIRAILLAVLKETKGNKFVAARRLNMHRNTLDFWVRKTQIPWREKLLELKRGNLGRLPPPKFNPASESERYRSPVTRTAAARKMELLDRISQLKRESRPIAI